MIQSIDLVVPSGVSAPFVVLQWVSVLPVLAFAALGLNYLALTVLGMKRTLRASPPPDAPPPPATDSPPVLIQIPVFNEGRLVEQVLRAVGALDYPRERLSIQLLDDSDDGSHPDNRDLALRVAGELGLRVEVLHRVNRHDYKAGALAAGLAQSTAPFVALFDADFLPPRDFLRRTVPLFADPTVGFVQARWGHANRAQTLLTLAQATVLDAHFLVEQGTRSAVGLPVAFNGTCGVWRRAALDSAGGWQGDTLTEDLDLALRTALIGYHGVFLPDLVVPGELPESTRAWQTQQYRWTKGFAQVLFKLGGRIWTAPWPLTWRVAVTLQLFQACFFPLAVASVLLTLPAVILDLPLVSPVGEILTVCGLLGLGGVVAFLTRAQMLDGRLHPWRTPRDIVLALTFTSGLMLSNTRAVIEAGLRRNSPFVRTPKKTAGLARPRPRAGGLRWPELLLGVAMVALFFLEQAWNAPFLAVLGTGLILLGMPDVWPLVRASVLRETSSRPS
ncbi:glycosyltransferase family 2 protein [Pararhodospirillum oryzae]|uniref:Glucosyltransferase n=1 Tax=Pararhodospirillum oryzae TaxID=478448 RepID=A0A512H3P3_9PROT|nr:glycosyltransferase family 2 protein [Pararhodospirillum oryzae]GEO80089.1 glucosyltransferase [Pararhodospirillum oryzae]